MAEERVPNDLALKHASKLSIKNDKPIMLDYWSKSLKKEIVIGVRGTGEKLLVKNEEEYTSPIAKIYKVETDYIIETENSLYLTCASISSKKIS
jgi:hypothetical protein